MGGNLLKLGGILLGRALLSQIDKLSFLVPSLIRVSKGFSELFFKLVVVIEDGLG